MRPIGLGRASPPLAAWEVELYDGECLPKSADVVLGVYLPGRGSERPRHFLATLPLDERMQYLPVHIDQADGQRPSVL